MLRLLLESNTRGFQFRPGALVSLAAHSILISVSVLATREGPVELIEEAQEKVVFLVPMNRTNSPPPREESVRFLRVGEKAGTGGSEEKIVDKTATRTAAVVGKGKEEGKPEEKAEEIVPNAIYDTVATAVDVDSTVTRFADSAAPAYPPKLLDLKVEGGAYVQFVVDTTGRYEAGTFKVLKSTNEQFTNSVKNALPRMKFYPAEVGGRKVKQLVQQPFTFSLQKS